MIGDGHVCALKRIPRRIHRKVRGDFTLRRDVALLDPCPLRDPLIRGINGLGEFVIRHDPLRQIRATADQQRLFQGYEATDVCRVRAALSEFPYSAISSFTLSRKS